MAVLNLGDVSTPDGQDAVQPAIQEKETPAEPSTVEKPSTEVKTEVPQDADALELGKQLTGLQQEKAKLLEEVKHLRGIRREIKQDQLIHVQKEMDDLKDVNPEDANLIDRVLRSKGYVSKTEMQNMYLKSTRDQAVTEFLEKYPEYKPENDSQDINWNTLQRELADYRMPESLSDIRRVLEKAHKSVTQSVGDPSLPAKKRAVETASAGTGGTQRSSSGKPLSSEQRRRYEDGGWSKDEIKELEAKL